MLWEQELLAEMRNAGRWLRILALPALRASLLDELNRPELARIYQESDGRDIRQVCSAAGVGFGTVHRHWQDWAAKGLLEPTDRKGRYRKVMDLKEVGLESLTKPTRKGGE